MKRATITGILEISGAILTIVGARILWGWAITCFVAAAWCLVLAYRLTPVRRPRA